MSEKFTYNENGEIMCKTPSGKTFVVARTDGDMYWADAIVHALDFMRNEEI